MKRVCLIEDNVLNRLLIEDVFEFDGIDAELVVFPDAEKALERIEELGPVLVLMDISLPGMSGIEATRRLRENPRTAQIPIWALTAHAMESVRVEAIEAGCNDYVTKPIDSAVLSKRLAEFIVGGVIADAA